MLFSRLRHSSKATRRWRVGVMEEARNVEAGAVSAAGSGSAIDTEPVGAFVTLGAVATGVKADTYASDLQQFLQVTSVVFEVALVLVAVRPQAVFSELMM
ncbi:hypothetical protein F2S72_09005 [Pseudomonas syringae pv. actinidiae]|nr:hypothetical protein [Pseudomonas syringae pv. actinidiae]